MAGVAFVAVALIAVVFIDTFETMILPRSVRHSYRLARLYYLSAWFLWRTSARMLPAGRWRHSFLSIFGPEAPPCDTPAPAPATKAACEGPRGQKDCNVPRAPSRARPPRGIARTAGRRRRRLASVRAFCADSFDLAAGPKRRSTLSYHTWSHVPLFNDALLTF